MGSKSSSGKALVILALIISILGLGLGVFSFITIQADVSSKPIVGLWESLYRNMDNPNFNTGKDWLIEVDDNKIINFNYIILDQGAQHKNTRFHLMKSGWYRVNLHLMLSGVSSTQGWYQMLVVKNGTTILYLLYEASMAQSLQVNRHFYISSDGNDYLEFNCFNFYDDFSIESQQVFNQLTIEYVGEY